MSAATIHQLEPTGQWNHLLSNKVVFISGGGGYIPQVIARTCYLHGAQVVLADINKQAALHVKQQILSQDNKSDVDNDERIMVVEVDVTNESAVKQGVELVMAKWHKINILINTTAIFPMGSIEEITDEVWNNVLSVNVKGYALMAKHVAPIMKQQQRSCSIINIASISGMVAHPNWVPYSTTKAAVIQMSKNLALDLGPYNIRVLSVSPGPIESPTLDHLAEARKTPKEKLPEAYAVKCLKRVGQAQEIANMVLFLASDLCDYCTGINIAVDGGITS